LKVSFLSLLLVAALGCTIPLEAGGGRGNSGGAWTPPPSDYSAEDLANGRMLGEMGSVRNFNDTLHNLSINTGYGDTYVEAHILGEYGWAMVGVTISGDLGVGDLDVGATLNPRNESRFYTYVVGCSGPDYQDFSFDNSPEDYEVTVAQDDAGELYLDVAANFGSDGTVTGVIPLPGVR